MNFTREPIIETVITARDGCRLVLRNSKGGADEEYNVEAVEVVSFGRSFFFRSVESGKAFLLPVTDYEVLESKEARMALKNVQSDRQIKIGGGREAQLRPQSQGPQKRDMRRPEPTREPRDEADTTAPMSAQQQQERKQSGGRRRRGRRGRGGDRPHDLQSQHSENHENPQQEYTEDLGVSEGVPQEAQFHSEDQPQPPKAPSFISKLFPPPPTLIKDSLSRYKTTEEVETTSEEKSVPFDETIFDHPISNEKDEDNHQDDR